MGPSVVAFQRATSSEGYGERALKNSPIWELWTCPKERCNKRCRLKSSAGSGPWKAVRSCELAFLTSPHLEPDYRFGKPPRSRRCGQCSKGKITVKVAPHPSSLSTSILPPWVSTIREQM